MKEIFEDLKEAAIEVLLTIFMVPILVGVRLPTIPQAVMIMVRATNLSKADRTFRILLFVLMGIPRALFISSVRVNIYVTRKGSMQGRVVYFLDEGIEKEIDFEEKTLKQLKVDKK